MTDTLITCFRSAWGGTTVFFLLSIFPAIFVGALATDDDDADQRASAEASDEEMSDDDGQVLVGTLEADSIVGGEGDDDITGLLGDDTLEGGPGSDILQGLNGDDLLVGGEGNDLMQGRGDDDTLQGFSGNDWVDGNDGEDLVRGGAGSDVVIGGLGSDVVNGRSGDDILVGGELVADPLTNAELAILRDGGTLDDIFAGETPPLAELRDDGAADTLLGEDGQDILILGAGDEATGGKSLDTFAIIADAADSDLGPATITDFNSPEGEAIALYFRADETVDTDAISVADDGDDAIISYDGEVLARVTGAAGTLSTADIGVLQLDDTSVTPELNGTDDPDTISGGSADEIINGLGGEDDLAGSFGNDTISGGDGSDIIQGQGGFDVITGNADNDFLQGRGGNDTLSGNQGFDWVDGNDGNDQVNGGLQADTVIGGNGSDVLSGGEGNDFVVGSELVADPLTNAQLDALRDGASLADALGVDLGPTIAHSEDGASDTLNGGNGSDFLLMGAGDVGLGGALNDTFGILAADEAVDAALIADFSADEDSIVVIDPDLSATETAPTVSVENEGGDALILFNGNLIARVTGAAGDITAADITLTEGVSSAAF